MSVSPGTVELGLHNLEDRKREERRRSRSVTPALIVPIAIFYSNINLQLTNGGSDIHLYPITYRHNND